MGIEIRSGGESQLYAKAGEIIGQSQARQRAREEANRREEINIQLASQERARQFEAEKMLYRDQQNFQHELRLRQADLDKEARSHEWEVEKAEIASRMDFEQEEKKRLQRREQMQNSLNYIDELSKDGRYTSDQVNDMRLQAVLPYQKDGFPEVSEILGTNQLLNREEQRKAALVGGGLEPRATDSTLTPEEQRQSDLIRGGLAPRVTEETAVHRRRELEAKVGPELSKFMDMATLERAAADIDAAAQEAGVDPNEVKLGTELIPTKGTLTNERPTVGQILTIGGKAYKIMGFDDNGEPLVDPVSKGERAEPGTTLEERFAPIVDELTRKTTLENYLSPITERLNKKTTLKDLVTKKRTLAELLGR